MKIALFSDTFSPEINGVTKNLDKLVNYFSNNGIEYLIFAPEYKNKTKNIHEKNIIRMKSYDFLLYPDLKFAVPNYQRVKKVLNEEKIDLVHLVTPFNIGLIGLYFAKQNDIPIIASYHTNFDQYLDYYNINFLEKAAWIYMRWFHGNASLNLCPSKITLEALKKREFSNLDVWGRGIDTDLFSPEHKSKNFIEKNDLEGKIKMLYVGRAAKEKNIYLLLESLNILNKKYGDLLELIITGDGPELENLKKAAPENVVFTGFKNGLELSQIYASSDIFVFSSLTETYGNVIIEAMASGLPVVAVNSGGVKENLINNYNGLTCEKDNPVEFSRILEKLILNNKLRDILGHNARQYSLEKKWKKVFENLIKNYIKVLDKDKKHGGNKGIMSKKEKSIV
ncbi:MAG: glycosyltransferase family 4 protein [Halanaerobium sp.]